MKILENITKTIVIIDEEGNQRYLMEKIWDESKPIPAILMLFPCSIDPVESDLTTLLVTNNLKRLDFGGVRVINLFSKIGCNIGKDDEPTTAENDKIIVETIARSEMAIIAYGKGSESNKKVEKRITDVLRLLEPFKDRLMTIQDPKGCKGFHPLTPSIRHGWELVKFDFPPLPKAETSVKETEKPKRGRKAQNEQRQSA